MGSIRSNISCVSPNLFAELKVRITLVSNQVFLLLSGVLIKMEPPIKINLQAFTQTIASALYISTLRRKYAKRRVKLFSNNEDLPNVLQKLQRDQEWEANVAVLERAIEDLPIRDQNIIRDRFWQKKSLTKIGETNGFGKDWVKSLIDDILARLRDALNDSTEN